MAEARLFYGDGLSQVTREVHVQALSNREPVGHQLQGDDVEETLETVDGLGDLDLLGLARLELLVVGVADDDRLA